MAKIQCAGTNKDGTPCRRWISFNGWNIGDDGEMYCHNHRVIGGSKSNYIDRMPSPIHQGVLSGSVPTSTSENTSNRPNIESPAVSFGIWHYSGIGAFSGLVLSFFAPESASSLILAGFTLGIITWTIQIQSIGHVQEEREIPKKSRCKAKTSSGLRCKRYALKYGDFLLSPFEECVC